MKPLPIFRVCVITGIVLLLPLLSYTQTFFGEASNPADNGSQVNTTVAVTPPGSMQIGDLVVIYAHYRHTSNALSLSETGGQTWTSETQSNGTTQRVRIFWCTFNGTWSADPSVTGGGGSRPMSVIMYVFRPTNIGSTWAKHAGPNNADETTAAVSITGLTTTVANTVTMAFWGSQDDNTWGGATGTNWNSTGSAQYRNRGGSDQSHTAAYNIRATAGTVADVSKSQTANGPDNTHTNIITFYEIPPPVPPNDICSGAISLSSAQTCTNTSGTLAGATYSAVAGACGASGGNRNDVWYSFVAQSTNPTIALSSAPSQASMQLFSGNCGTLTSVQCATNSTTLSASGLTIGVTYYIRIFSDNNTAGTFDICVTDPPSNDECAGAVTLVSGQTCSTTSGTLSYSTYTSVTGACGASGGDRNDVWYSFVAQSTNPTIALSSAPSQASIQLFSGNCGSLTSLQCATNSTTLSASGLTVGATYYVRIFSDNNTDGTFNICIVDPPTNDECSNAITLPLGGSCANISGSVAGATVSATPVAPCTGPVGYDVWYKFDAVNTTANITLSSIGAGFTNSRLQLFSGSCSGLTSIFCGTTTIAATGLTAGNTYYIRVYSTSTTIPSLNGNFNICVSTTSPPPRFGNSYVNVSKRSGGGVVQPGDTLEIRMTINHTSGTMYRLRYVDNVPTHTQMLTGAGERIRIITNEGLPYKQYTLDAGDDAATYVASPGPGEYNVRLNLAFGSSPAGTVTNNTATDITNTDGTMVSGSDRPRGGGGMLFATAFRVVVTGNVGDTIRLNPGQFIYRTSTGGSDLTLTGTPYEILISDPMSLCENSTGINNAQELGGTFGSGTTLNRSYDLAFPIPGYTHLNNVSSTVGVGDGRYAIVKNLSPRSGTIRTADRTPTCPTALPSEQACGYRMHNGHWDIDGDHTGTNDAIGNVPPAESQPGGYMLMVNADYVASETYRQSLTNLCPNTYYEFSAWIRNICPTCGMDSTGTSYLPRVPGVLPNLTFVLDGVDRYSTGEVEAATGWIKKGFVFRTGPSQTNATFSIRNNSQGGGGNDWAMDDISIATCLPNMEYSPTMTPIVCESNSITVYDTIRSYFDNYVYYKWQRSMDDGGTWTDLTPDMGPVTPYWNGSAWEYVTSWTIPPGSTTPGDSSDLYRVLVATTTSNLSNTSCQVTDDVNIITLSVINCGPVLKTELLSFNGKLENGYAVLNWTTSKEDELLRFEMERSRDGINFTRIGTVMSYGSFSAERNNYSFTDPEAPQGKMYYRISMVNNSNNLKYSRIVQLSKEQQSFILGTVINPFASELLFDVQLTSDAKVEAILTDMLGKPVKTKTFLARSGVNGFRFDNTDMLAPGIYMLQVKCRDAVLTRKVMKAK